MPSPKDSINMTDDIDHDYFDIYSRYDQRTSNKINSTSKYNGWSTVQPSEASQILASIRHKVFYNKSDLIEDMLPCKQSDGSDLYLAVNN